MNAPVQIDIATRVRQYVALRDKIKEKEDAHKAELAPFKLALEQLNSVLLNHLNSINGDNVSTEFGTVYRTEKKAASIADMSAFWTYVVTQGDFEMLDKKANVKAVEDYINQQVEAAKSDPTIIPGPPPGVNFTITNVVGVRRK